MKKFRSAIIILLVLCTVAGLPCGALALDGPQIGAGAAVLANAESGQIYYEHNAQVKMYPASLTKIMTVLLAVEAIENDSAHPGDAVTVSANVTRDMVPDGSTANIVEGEVLTLEQLLYCAMLSSANEACNVIAEYIGGSIDGFIAMMNSRAAELGCEGTHFANPHGLHSEEHYTTAFDMYLILSEAMSHDLFVTLCSTVNYTVPATNKSPARELSNSNGLINADTPYYSGCYYEYAIGGKTGYTSNAGYCLASAAEKDGVKLYAVVMGCEAQANPNGGMSYGSFLDSITLYEWVFNNFSFQDILSSSELITSVPVSMASDGGAGVALRPRDVITALIPNDADIASFERSYVIYSEQSGEELVAPISAGTVLGEITVSYNGSVYGSTALVAAANVEMSKSEYLKHQLKTTLDLTWVKVVIWVLVALLVVYLLLVIRYRRLHKRHQRDVQKAKEARESRAASGRHSAPAPERKPAPAPEPKPQPTAPEPVTAAAKPARDEQAEKDYFEEFFRRKPEDK